MTPSVRLIGVEAGGEGHRVAASTRRASPTLRWAGPGVLHGTCTYVLQDADGQIAATHSISAGLDYPAVGPEHAYLRDLGRAEYTYASDDEALAAFQLLARTEGILPALESSHAIAEAVKLRAEDGQGRRSCWSTSPGGATRTWTRCWHALERQQSI